MELKTLIAKRGGIKAQLTSFGKYLDSFDITSENSYLELNERFNKFETCYDKFNDIQLEIDAFEADENKSFIERDNFDNLFFSLVSKAKVLLSQLRNNDKNTESHHSVHSTSNLSDVKLPRIDLPTFSGKYTDWQEFYDGFNALVNSNSKLSDVERLIYLKSALTGEASSVVKTLKTTEANYEIAWKALCERYQKKRRIIDTHVREILNFNNVNSKTKDAHVTLRKFINDIENNIRCLEALGQQTEAWDSLLIPIILGKLDEKINIDWEARINKQTPDYLPTFSELITFLSIKQSTLETTTFLRPANDFVKPRYTKSFATVNNTECPLCKQNHGLHQCEQYLKFDTNKRIETVKQLKLCLNCLKNTHFIRQCKSSSCKTCGKKHHTTLHIYLKAKEGNANTETDENVQNTTTCNSNIIKTMDDGQVILPTAEIYAYDDKGCKKTLRALLDSASQSSFITTSACKLLNLRTENANLTVTGINQGMSKIIKKVEVKIGSRQNNYKINIQCFILDKITGNLPSARFKVSNLDIPSNIKLADTKVNIPGSIDMLLGANVFWDLLSVGQIKTKHGTILHKTKLGWIVSGSMYMKTKVDRSSAFLSINKLHEDLKAFWKVDEFSNERRALTPEEKHCEEYFRTTTKRGEDGKFIVKIPLKEDVSMADNCYGMAINRFHALENRFNRNENIRKMYTDCLEDYMTQGHMTETIHDQTKLYIPHHAVFKDSSTTHLRVVFDASRKSNLAENSINDMQCVGATIQDDLFSIVSRFRKHQFVITADIAQMYRQVWVSEDDRKLQTILWRNSEDSPIKSYALNTVTFGMASAPFLAIRCLVEVANLNKEKYPKECNIIKNDFYVDDLVTGANSINELEELKLTLSDLLSSYGFKLRKWKDNYSFTNDDNSLEISKNISKVLGVGWDPQTDEFIFNVSNLKQLNKVNKRSILAITSQLFDPLGLVSPVIVNAKLIIQDLWQLKLSWDESIPTSLHTRWIQFKSELSQIKDYRLPRCILVKNATLVEFHCFSDASERAYGACIYVRSKNKANECKVRLLASKSRVSPLSKVTLPRLELLAAVLMAQLFEKFKNIFDFNINEYFWTDSKIVLSWIQSSPNRWATFVANRVAFIQENTNVSRWFHVKTEDNAADLVSRGCQPSQIDVLKQFWQGPSFLYRSELPIERKNQETLDEESLPERKEKRTFTLVTTVEISFIERFSSYTRLVNTMAWCMRFKNNCIKGNKKTTFNTLTLAEIKDVLLKIIKQIQINYFPEDYDTLKRKKLLHPKSKLLSLSPFIDENEILRVGGRLINSNFEFNKKHPILLPKNCHFTKLLFKHKHQQLFHAGPNLLLSCVREEFWPISGKSQAKQVCRNCVICRRYNAKTINPVMGNLPCERIKVSSPFHTVGVDYAGPILFKDKAGRGAKLQKAYISLFICFATKAIHLELVTSLSTDAFIACFKRFIARRGKPSKIFSDNGTNFQGAKNEIYVFKQFLAKNKNILTKECTNEELEWKFIPAYSPHFGGLWEANIKSVKSHLKKTIGNATLTFEDLYTVLVQIEAILNSRPLMPLSSDPNDLTALTPSHFLIGRPLCTLPEEDVVEVRVNRLDRFQRLQQLSQHFWKRWSTEYIHQLQQRSKWRTTTENISKGALVLIQDQRLPPCKWPLGRVVKLCAGADGVVRVVEVKTSNGTSKRSVTSLIPLPVDEDNMASEQSGRSEGQKEQ